jgi:hypothetical protein
MSTVEQPGQPQTPAGYQSQSGQPQYAQPQFGQPVPYVQQPGAGMYVQPMHAAPAPYGAPMGPIGQIRSTWAVLLLSIITFGIYGLYYYFVTHEEMKRHSGEGVGGAVGLVIALFTFGLVTPFLLPNEIGNLYARQGRPRPVSATTGLWVLLGSIILIGPLVWLIKSNGALNAYWRSLGAS